MSQTILFGLENGSENRSIAWVFAYPGCFAYGKDGSEAILNLPQALIRYAAWHRSHTAHSWVDLGNFDLRLAEVFEVYTIDENFNLASAGYEVNAFFRDDWKPLTRLEIRRGLEMLSWSRQDLLALAAALTAEQLDEQRPGERWSIRGILGHIAGAENWYLDRLGLAIKTPPEDAFERLRAVREHFEQMLPTLEGVTRVEGKKGEIWSPRKILRRALWHELDHIEHIRKLAAASPAEH